MEELVQGYAVDTPQLLTADRVKTLPNWASATPVQAEEACKLVTALLQDDSDEATQACHDRVVRNEATAELTRQNTATVIKHAELAADERKVECSELVKHAEALEAAEVARVAPRISKEEQLTNTNAATNAVCAQRGPSARQFRLMVRRRRSRTPPFERSTPTRLARAAS